jgi:hypothetical protein
VRSVALTFDERRGIQIKSMEDAIAWGEAVIASGMAPRGFAKTSQVIVAVQMGRELGLEPMAALRSMYVPPSGRPQLMAEAALAVVMSKGLLVEYDEVLTGEGDMRTATFRALRQGWTKHRESHFSLKEARKAGLVKADSGWEKWTDRMLRARARSFGLHDWFPDVLLGIAIEGDVEDDRPVIEADVVEAPKPALTSPIVDPLLDDQPVDEVVAEQSAPPQSEQKAVASEVPVRCKKHKVELDQQDRCWMCDAEAEERAETEK